MIRGRRKVIGLVYCCTLFFSGVLSAQPPEQLLKKAADFQQRDQLDSATFYYQQLRKFPSAQTQLQSLTGLIKVAIARSEMDSAKVLLTRAEQLLAQQQTDLETTLQFQIIRGEYLRKKTQFKAALKAQQEVVLRTKGIPEFELLYADALYYAGLTYERMGAFDSSLVYVEQAYEILQQKLDTTSLRFSSIYNGMAVCYQRANKLDRAEYYYLRSKSIAEEKIGPVSQDLAICLNNLSSIYRSKEQYGKAIQYSEQALRIFDALGDTFGKSGAYYALGIYHYFLGDYGRTKDYIEACIAIREKLFDEQHHSLIGPYEVLGITHDEAGNYEKTLYYLEKVRPIIIASYGGGSVIEGYNYENTAISFKNIGQLDSALFYMRLSNDILPKVLPKNDYALAGHFYSYADILFALGKLASAAHYLSKSDEVSRALSMENSSEYAQNLALSGLIRAEQGRWAEADEQFASALQKIRIADGPPADSVFQLTPNALAILNEYMNYLFRKYQASQEAGDLELFDQYADIYLSLSDAFRRQFIDPTTKSILIKDNAEVYQRNIAIYNKLYRISAKREHLLAAYRFSEYSRTSMLRDMQDEKIKVYAGIPDAVLQKETRLKKAISELRTQLIEKPADTTIKTALLEQKEQLNAHIQKTKAQYPRYFDLKFRSSVPEISEIQNRLSGEQCIIEYMMDDTAYYTLIISAKEQELFYLNNRSKINQELTDWQKGITTQDLKLTLKAGSNLYHLLWQKLEAAIPGEQVIIIPVGHLFYLNFETLVRHPATADYLILDYDITYALSITTLMANEQEQPAAGVLAVAPGFEPDLKENYLANLDSLDIVDEAYLKTLRQPWSVKLANQMTAQFGANVLLGAAASESRVKSNLDQGKVLFFGTHAIINPLDPLRSKLVLAKEDGPQKEDGYLHAYELYGQSLNAKLAILNACESGLGNLQAGEGMISLAYSLHYAGCPSTLMSLWKVDEKTSTKITGQFLKNLTKGLSVSTALRRAKLDYLKQKENKLLHPFYWSGLVLMGKDQTINIDQRSNNWLYPLVIGVLIVVGFWWQKKKTAL